MSTNTTATTQMKRFRLPHEMCARLSQQENMSAYVIKALQAQFRRDDIAAAKQPKKR